MSYCRWSTVCEDNFESDLYIYDHVDGYIAVEIASGRMEGVEQAPQNEHLDPFSRYLSRREWVRENADRIRSVPIDLQYAGKSYQFTEAGACVSFLKTLKDLGYHMPDRVLDESIYEGYE